MPWINGKAHTKGCELQRGGPCTCTPEALRAEAAAALGEADELAEYARKRQRREALGIKGVTAIRPYKEEELATLRAFAIRVERRLVDTLAKRLGLSEAEIDAAREKAAFDEDHKSEDSDRLPPNC